MGLFISHGSGFVGHAVATLEDAHGDGEVVVNCICGGKWIQRAADGVQRSMRAGECAEFGLLHLQEGFVLPVEILLRSEVGLILLQQAVNSAGGADVRVAEALNQRAHGVGGQHAGGVGKGYDVPAQFPYRVVQNRHLAAIFLEVEKTDSSAGFARPANERTISAVASFDPSDAMTISSLSAG